MLLNVITEYEHLNKVINNDIKKVTNTATENNSSPAMLLFIMEL